VVCWSDLARTGGARLPWLVSWRSLVGDEQMEEEGATGVVRADDRNNGKGAEASRKSQE
jgi:hypothetical protein